MAVLKKQGLWNDMRGDAVVEAAILFPIIMMIFAGLVLLAIYMPTRALLQRATQYAATAVSVQESDSFLYFDDSAMDYGWYADKDDLPNVYVQFFGSLVETAGERADKEELAEAVVADFVEKGLPPVRDKPEVTCEVRNYVIYKEVSVTATSKIHLPVNLRFVGLPEDISITVTSTSVVQDGDGFVRNMDMLTDFVEYLDKKYNLKLDTLKDSLSKVWDFMGIG